MTKFISTFLVLSLSLPLLATALSLPQGTGGFVIYPAKLEIAIDPGESSQDYITLINQSNKTLNFTVGLEDLKATAGAAEPVILLGREPGPYSLKKYTTLSTDKITVAPGGSGRIGVAVSVPSGTPPAGLYGAVTIATQTGGGEANAQVVTRGAALVFTRITGPIEEAGRLLSFRLTDGRLIFGSEPVRTVVNYENTGSIYLNPYGYIAIENLFGREVGRINIDPWFVLPDSSRIRDLEWRPGGSVGWYRAKLYLNRGYGNIVDESSASFLLLPWWAVAVGAILLILVFLVMLKLRRRP